MGAPDGKPAAMQASQYAHHWGSARSGIPRTLRCPSLSLLLAVSGRRVALDDLSGPGVATLAAGS
ncbi:hypothetical protein ACFRQM_41595 [Streptomyces sp. NPDC056831]|uniref:hypothetical protein n=1 Tax=Streptomyces sp. NPDC056831 TaxID=3345954 RepID=UPI0036A3BC2B